MREQKIPLQIQVKNIVVFFVILKSINTGWASNYQIIKNVLLVYVYGDERLKLGALDLGQVGGGDVNQLVQQLAEPLVGRLHHLLVHASVGQRILSLFGPDHLQT